MPPPLTVSLSPSHAAQITMTPLCQWRRSNATLVLSMYTRSRLMKIIRPMTPLRQRMLEDMQIRNYSPHTVDASLRRVAQCAKHFHTSPERLGPDHIRTYQQFLIEEQQASWGTFIQAVCALRFFYETTLHRPWMVDSIPYPKKPKTLPVILSRDEVKALLLAPRHLKHRVILATLYATGVRVSELCQLQGTDIDSHRMVIQVRQGKGKRDRFVMLPQPPAAAAALLEALTAPGPALSGPPRDGAHYPRGRGPYLHPSRPRRHAEKGCVSSFIEAHICDPSARSRGRPASHPIVARPC